MCACEWAEECAREAAEEDKREEAKAIVRVVIGARERGAVGREMVGARECWALEAAAREGQTIVRSGVGHSVG